MDSNHCSERTAKSAARSSKPLCPKNIMTKKILKSSIIFIVAVIVSVTIIVYIESKRNFNSIPQEAFDLYTRHIKSIRYGNEISFIKELLQHTINEEHPSPRWYNKIGESLSRSPDESFYVLKVWFIESGISTKDIQQAYPLVIWKDEYAIRISLKYSPVHPCLNFNIFKGKNNLLKADAFFPLNNCLFSADYNKDDEVDYADVIAARKYWANRLK
jgi:hypothetical protein